MKNSTKYNKSDLAKFIVSISENESSDKDIAKKYLESEGVNVSKTLSEGLNKIKRIQMRIEAQKTKVDMLSYENQKQKAISYVNELLAKIDFSLPTFIRQEGLSMSFRNVEELNSEDIKNILVKHFALKFLNEQNINS
jgi:hypothetical protein